MRIASRLTFAVAVLVAPLVCEAKTIRLSVDAYVPQPDASLRELYKGSHLRLIHFTNEAEDTGLWSYESSDGKTSFKTSHNLNTYLWRCFEKAAMALDMLVYRDAAGAPDVSELDIVFSSWTQERFVARVSLMKGGRMVYQKERQITLPPVTSTDPAALALQAYASLDAIVKGILGDEAFQAAFFGKTM